LYTLALLILQYALPLGVLLFTYSRIATEVWGTRPPGEAHNLRDMRMAKNKRKVGAHFSAPLTLFYCFCRFLFIIAWSIFSTPGCPPLNSSALSEEYFSAS